MKTKMKPNWKSCKLGEVCKLAKDRITVADLNSQTYISTENMLPNKTGITTSAGLPTTSQTQRFCTGDVLVSNIRPYFKKIWLAQNEGGCSNDIFVFRANQSIDSRFLF
jgi:type I restriction enzyme S subunit